MQIARIRRDLMQSARMRLGIRRETDKRDISGKTLIPLERVNPPGSVAFSRVLMRDDLSLSISLSLFLSNDDS